MTPQSDAAGAARAEVSIAERVAEAVTAVDGVTGLHGGVFGEIATYLPGARVSGVRLTEEGGEVHVIVDIAHDLRAVAEVVKARASEIAGVPVTVTIEDVSVAGQAPAPGVPSPEDEQTGTAQPQPEPTAEVKNDG